MGRFEFVVLAKLRAHQLNRGCLPRIDSIHLRAVTAQLEVALGYVVQMATSRQMEEAIHGDPERRECDPQEGPRP
jgi:hypothetical protein